ncbi:hypothetical protein Tco_1135694 [Tanacetum coccineum]
MDGRNIRQSDESSEEVDVSKNVQRDVKYGILLHLLHLRVYGVILIIPIRRSRYSNRSLGNAFQKEMALLLSQYRGILLKSKP